MKIRINHIITLMLAALMLAAPAQAASVFLDVDGDAPYAEAAEYLNEIGIMMGDENGNFNPDKTVTRAEMAAIICRMLGETENLTTSNIFTDVPVSHWANGFIEKAASLKIIGGYGSGKFGPTDDVTYEQSIAMIVRTIYGNDEGEDAGGYPDGFLVIASENGLLNNVSAEKGDYLSRADAAMILFNYYNLGVSG